MFYKARTYPKSAIKFCYENALVLEKVTYPTSFAKPSSVQSSLQYDRKWTLFAAVVLQVTSWFLFIFLLNELISWEFFNMSGVGFWLIFKQR